MASAASDLRSASGLPLVEAYVESADDDSVVLNIPGTHYRPALKLEGRNRLAAGTRVTGVIRVQPQRIDVAGAGGRFVEPCLGRPRRIQGRVIGGNLHANELYVRAGFTVVATPAAPQSAGQFHVGELAMFDACPGASFEPLEPAHPAAHADAH